MEKKVLWDKEFPSQCYLISLEELNMFLELLQFIHDNKITDYIYEKTVEDEELWGWIYSRDNTDLIDVKKELSKKIQKVKTLKEDMFEKDLICLGKNEKPRIFLCSFSEKDIFYISSIQKFYIAMRKYLSMEKKDEFCKDLHESFPAILFVTDIDASINTLNQKFETIKDEIINHLTELNNYNYKFLELLEENKSYTEISQIFKYDTGIDCSPQSGRDHTKELKIECQNSVTEKKEIVKCELHTKFKTFNIDRLKQDRIYFFPGKRGIEKGRIIVLHIGKHL